MFYLCYCYLFIHTGVQHDYHIRLCSCGLTVTGVTCGAVTVNPFVAHLVFSGVRAVEALIFLFLKDTWSLGDFDDLVLKCCVFVPIKI